MNKKQRTNKNALIKKNPFTQSRILLIV